MTMSDIDLDVLLAALSERAEATASWDTLPPEVYRSEAVFDLEVERLFRAGWVNVGHVSQLPRPGDRRTVDTVGELLIVTRDRDGEIHVLSRVCPHRWMDVCSEPAGARTGPKLQCPYHRWTFEPDGRLRAAPEMERTPGFDRSDHGLHEFRHEVWQGFIYVNLDGGAPSTSELWGPMGSQVAGYGLADWQVVDSTPWGRSAWDWKVFIDNGECYHHLGIHLDTLQPVFPARLVEDLPDNGEFTLLSAPAAADLLVDAADGGRDLPHDDPPAPGLDDRQRTSLGLAYPFPNYVIAVLPQSAFWFEVHPVGPGSIEFTSHLLLPPYLIDAPGHDERVAAHRETFTAIHEQDIVVCEGVQQGLQTTAARTGRLSHLEQHNRTFAHWYARHLTAEPAPAPGAQAGQAS